MPEATAELTSETLDRLMGFQAEDESLTETLERLVLALPHSVKFKDAGIDPEELDSETRYVTESWPDEDGIMMTRAWTSPSAFILDHELQAEAVHASHLDDGEIVGEASIKDGDAAIQMMFVDGTSDAWTEMHLDDGEYKLVRVSDE